MSVSTGSALQNAQKEVDVDDRHWDDAVPRREKKAPSAVQHAYTHCRYEAHYLEMRDGVRIATDVLRPPAGQFDESRGLPCVLIQTRYQRSTMARWPLRKLLNGRPLDLLAQETRSWLLAAGYAVVAVDVRGTGASFGQWRAPWQSEERADSVQVVDWIVTQPWSNQQCVLWGVSYDGTAALFTVAQQHPAVKAATPQYAFWDIYDDIGLPGGIPLHSFAASWTRHCLAFDSNDHSQLPKPTGWLLPLVIRGCQPVIEGLRLGSTSSKGSAGASTSSLGPSANSSSTDGSSSATGSHVEQAGARQQHNAAAVAARRAGLRQLREAVRGHDTWRAAIDLAAVRCTDDMAPIAKKRVTDISACSASWDIARSGVPLSITAGWLDSTAGPAITMFMTAAKAPGSRLLLGPWGHGGHMYCQLPERAATRSAFSQPLDAIAFFDAACGYRPTGRPVDAFGAKLAYSSSSSSKQHSSTGHAHAQHAQHHSSANGSADGHTDTPAAHCNGYTATAVIGLNHATGGGSPGQQAAVRQVEAEGLAALGPAVRYFVMGYRPHWRSSATWPPEDAAGQPLVLHLRAPPAGGGTGAATASSPGSVGNGPPALGARDATDPDPNAHSRRQIGRSARDVRACKDGRLEAEAAADAASASMAVDTSRFLKGTSRFDVITQPTATIQYRRLRSAGHALFTGAPLAAELQIVGWPEVVLWVASSNADADVFVYLEDYDPVADVARYVTEGHFRASHRKEHVAPPPGDPRAASHIPGMPFHSFTRQDLQPLTPGEPVKVRFVLLPTAYGFARGHCVRVAIAGADSKHFTVDHQGDRTIWVHTGGDMPSRIILPQTDIQQDERAHRPRS